MPKKPIPIAIILRTFTTSPKKNIAPIVKKIGVLKLIAVTWAKGIKVNAENPAIIPMLPKNALIKNSLGLFILSTLKPFDLRIGTIIMAAKKLRKKTTSKIGIFSADLRMHIAIPVNITVETNSRKIARACLLLN
jgi:hypothetical protein